MCSFPLPTTSLCNQIFDEYEKIFTASDRFFDVEMNDESAAAEFKAYLDDISFHTYLQTIAFRAYQNSPGSIFVIDLPSEQVGSRPQPYIYKLPLKSIIDISFKRNADGKDEISFLLYKVSDKVFVAIDDIYYRVFTETTSGGEITGTRTFSVTTESAHNLGYTPATFLPQATLYDENGASRKTQVSSSLGDLDWLLFYKVAQRMYETYGPFPIMSVPDEGCTYSGCDGGVIHTVSKRTGLDCFDACPACAKSSFTGPGTIIKRSTPRTKEDAPLGPAVEITPADIESLEYIKDNIDYTEWEIYAACVGSDDRTQSAEAVNEKQVQASVEGKRNVLARVRKEFESFATFVVNTMGKLMYAESYAGCTYNLGEQVLLYTAKDITDQFTSLKKAGVPGYLVSQKKQQLIQTEFKNNPQEQAKAELLNLLEPWPDLSLTECTTHQLHLLYPDLFFLKLDFAKFVSKFEITNGNIVTWGSLLNRDVKIQRLTQILLSYVTEIKPRRVEQTQQSGTASAL